MRQLSAIEIDEVAGGDTAAEAVAIIAAAVILGAFTGGLAAGLIGSAAASGVLGGAASAGLHALFLTSVFYGCW
jgi:hypothetical protein